MLSAENRRMLKCGMRAPLAPLLAEQIRECECLVNEGLMTLGEEGYVTTEAGRQLYDREMRRIARLFRAQISEKEHAGHGH